MLISKERLSELFDLYYTDIYRYCCKIIRNTHDAEDITQETFALLVEKANQLEDKNIRAWLHDVALIKIKKIYQHKMVESRYVKFSNEGDLNIIDAKSPYSLDDELIFEDYSPEVIDEHKEKILSYLTTEEKELYTDVFINKKKYKEIAEERGLKTKTVNVRSHRLKTKIKGIVKNILGTFIFVIRIII